MKRIFYLPLVALIFSGCDVKQGLDNANNWIEDNIFDPITGNTGTDSKEQPGEDTKPDIPDHVHEWSSSYSSDDYYHWKTCLGCDEISQKGAHTVSYWSVSKEATIYEAGLETGNCNVCGRQLTREIPKKSAANRYVRYDDTIELGTYPQSLVTDENVLETLPSDKDSISWTSFNYIEKNNPEDLISYSDFDINYDGINDYRAILIKKYRSYYSSNLASPNTTYQDDNGFELANIYWFKYEPIQWNVIGESNGLLKLVSDKGLDSQYFAGFYQADEIEVSHNGGTGYLNNYELSDVRSFLNKNFFNTAFSAKNKEIISKTSVDNTTSSMRNADSAKYACKNTQDNVFLLSYKEAENLEKDLFATDYAKSQNAKVNADGTSPWMLRSPHALSHNKVEAVAHSSEYLITSSTFAATRPAMNINALNPVSVYVSSANEEQGTVSSKKVSAPAGSLAKVNAIPQLGYKFVGWYKNNQLVSQDEEYEFEIPSSQSSLEARFSPRDNIPYLVEHRLQDPEDENKYDEIKEITECYGELGQLPVWSQNEYPFFVYDHKSDEEPIAADGSTVVKLYYNREKFEFSYNNSSEHGTISEENEISSGALLPHGKSITLNAIPSQGYHLDGWYNGEEKLSDEVKFTFQMPTSDFSIDAKWAPNEDTPFTVKHYLSIEGVEDELLLEETQYGTTDALSNAQYAEFPDKHCHPRDKEIDQQIVQANGETIVSLFYSLNDHTLTFEMNYDDAANCNIEVGEHTYTFDETIQFELKDIAKKYDFRGWFINDETTCRSKELSFDLVMPDEDVKVAAKFEYGTFSYKINHMIESTTDGQFDLLDYEEYGSGVYGNNMTFTQLSIDGYSFDHSDENAIIQDKDKDEQFINVYYVRNEYNLTVNVNDSTLGHVNSNIPSKLKYGCTTTLTAIPSNDARFLGWYDEEDKLVSSKNPYILTMQADDCALTAKFEHYYHTYDANTHECKCGKLDPEYVKIEFRVTKETTFGQDVFICGLNNTWDANDRVAMTWTEGHVWTATLALKKGEEITFKFILVDGDNVYYEKEGFDNERHFTPQKSDTVTLTWGSY